MGIQGNGRVGPLGQPREAQPASAAPSPDFVCVGRQQQQTIGDQLWRSVYGHPRAGRFDDVSQLI